MSADGGHLASRSSLPRKRLQGSLRISWRIGVCVIGFSTRVASNLCVDHSTNKSSMSYESRVAFHRSFVFLDIKLFLDKGATWKSTQKLDHHPLNSCVLRCFRALSQERPSSSSAGRKDQADSAQAGYPGIPKVKEIVPGKTLHPLWCSGLLRTTSTTFFKKIFPSSLSLLQ